MNVHDKPIQKKFREDWLLMMTFQGKGKVSGQKRQERKMILKMRVEFK